MRSRLLLVFYKHIFMRNLILAFFLIAVLSPASAQDKPIKILRNDQGGYFLLVDDKPFMMKGIGYNPTPIGEGYDYYLFTDENKPWAIDGKLMQEMGINCIRVYSASKDLDKVKEFIEYMHNNFGIYTIVSDWLGLWSNTYTNYADETFRNQTKDRIIKMVQALKDTKGLLIWNLGNENNYTFSGTIGFWTSTEIEQIQDPYQKILKKAEVYYSFVNDLAKEIKKIDTVHPVALGNGEANFLDIAAKVCPDIDALSIIVYRGKKFGNLFDNIRRFFDKPIFLSEFGCDSYNAYKNEEDQDIQTKFIIAQWQDLYKNTIAGNNPNGNILGGIIFEWNDEWWKHNEGYAKDWKTHNLEAGWSNGAYYFDNRAENNLNMNEEWFGIVSLSEETEDGVNKRIPKQSYYGLKNFFSSISNTTAEESIKAAEKIPVPNAATNATTPTAANITENTSTQGEL